MKMKLFLSMLVLSLSANVMADDTYTADQEFNEIRQDFIVKAGQLRTVKSAEEAKVLFFKALKKFVEMRNLNPNDKYVSVSAITLINQLKELDKKFKSKIKEVYQSQNMPTLVIQAIEEFKKLADNDPERAAQLLEDIHDLYTWKNMKAEEQGKIRSHLGVRSLDDWYKEQKKALNKK